MRFIYSIAYPDRKEIDYFNKEIGKDQIIKVFKNFDWNEELKKKIISFNPSIEIKNIVNKEKIIFTGIGSGQLEEFLIILVFPRIKDYSNKPTKVQHNNHNEIEFLIETDTAETILKLFLVGRSKQIVDEFAEVENSNGGTKESYTLVEKLISRVGGSVLTILTLCTIYMLAKEKIYGWPMIIAIFFLLVFVIGTVRFELNLKQEDLT